jgi:hypothetical protein
MASRMRAINKDRKQEIESGRAKAIAVDMVSNVHHLVNMIDQSLKRVGIVCVMLTYLHVTGFCLN